jgi:hypothetical protein
VRVHYGEGRSVPHRPRVMRGHREVAREALTGVCAGQVVSGESNAVRGADAVVAAEGNRGGSVSARTRTTPRRQGDPGMYIRLLHGNRESSVIAPWCQRWGRAGKAGGRSW